MFYNTIACWVILVLLSFVQTNAQIQYYSFPIPVEIEADHTEGIASCGGQSFAWDVDQDGQLEGELHVKGSCNYKGVLSESTSFYYDLGLGHPVEFLSGEESVIWGGSPYTINGVGAFIEGNEIPILPNSQWSANCNFSWQYAYDPFYSSERYAAFRVQIEGNWHYGWIRLNVIDDGISIKMTIYDFAYQSQAEIGITAGEGSPQQDCSSFLTAPVDLTKSFAPVAGVHDRVQLKWFKESPSVKYSIEDNAACDIEYWAYRYKESPDGNWINIPTAQRDTSRLPYTTVKKTNDQPLFKWPLKFRLANGTNQVLPNRGYRWRTRCYCDHGNFVNGEQVISPWSEVRFFNTPDFDIETGIYTPPGGLIEDSKSLLESSEALLYPNPSDGNSLNLQGIENIERIVLVDPIGRAFDILTTQDKGEVRIVFPSQLRSGLYTLLLDSSDGIEHLRFVVE